MSWPDRKNALNIVKDEYLEMLSHRAFSAVRMREASGRFVLSRAADHHAELFEQVDIHLRGRQFDAVTVNFCLSLTRRPIGVDVLTKVRLLYETQANTNWGGTIFEQESDMRLFGRSLFEDRDEHFARLEELQRDRVLAANESLLEALPEYLSLLPETREPEVAWRQYVKKMPEHHIESAIELAHSFPVIALFEADIYYEIACVILLAAGPELEPHLDYESPPAKNHPLLARIQVLTDRIMDHFGDEDVH